MMTDQRPATPARNITYCCGESTIPNMFTLHRAWAPFGDAWLAMCDTEEPALSLPDGVGPDSKFFIQCKICFPAPPPPRVGSGPGSP